MVADFSAEEILEVTGGRLASGIMPDGAGAICTDTRSIEEGQWYLALSGERFDGHDFMGDAFARGALGCIVSERPAYPIAASSFPLIAVPDSLAAYHALAQLWRERINPQVVAITGSSGKTTTKEMCASVFASVRKTHKSRANENNEIGLPKTLLSMPDDTDVLVLELAMRARGEIALLAKTARPDMGIIVNVSAAHLGPLCSLDNIIAAKCELFEALNPASGIAIVGRPDQDLMRRVRQVFPGRVISFSADEIQEIEVTPAATTFEVKSEGKTGRFKVKAHGRSHLQDAWCAIIAGREQGMSDEEIARGLWQYEPIEGRGNRLPATGGAMVVDESYNANPDSVRSSVDAFVDDRVYPQSKKYVVLGDLAELGDTAETLHHGLGEWLKQKQLSALITVGSLARHIAQGAEGADFEIIACQDQIEAEKALRAKLTSDSCVLVKGSHAASLDRLVSRLVAEGS